ncbi:nucleoporin complex subunit 54-domain-containing protein [Gorgonomyces haynaldii]|nr:nucleoporin complex subunit 54-domain-containing protein [Gorgonomyces haynaldii]
MFGAKPGTFGQQNTTQNTGFGQQNTGFGQPAAPSGGLFGQQKPTVQVGQPTTGFGQPQTTQAGGLFGQPATTPSTGLFGQTNTTGLTNPGFGQPQTSQPAATGLFGQPAITTPATGLFGQTAPAPTTNLFGQQAAPTTSLFAQQPATSLFGQQKPGFGQPAQQQMPPPTNALEAMQQAWNPASPYCHFKHYFYNFVHPNEIHLYTVPPNQDPQAYEQAQKDNPDPTCYVPVLAVGFGDLQKRRQMQQQYNQVQQEKLQEISKSIDNLSKKHQNEFLVKLVEYKRRQSHLIHRVLSVMAQVQMLRNNGYSIHDQEEQLMSKLKLLERELDKPALFKGRLNEVWASVMRLSEMGTQEQAQVQTQEQLEPVYEALVGMQSGLKHLTQVIKQDEELFGLLQRGYQERVQ